MSMRVYKKHVWAEYPIVAYCGYCDLQYTLYFTPNFGHTERAEGWGCDVYEIAPDIALTTGYALLVIVGYRWQLQNAMRKRHSRY